MVALQAEGDREVRLEEVVELADVVAEHEGVATGMGTLSYGAQIVVEAESDEEAVERAIALFSAAADRAGLPRWPIVNIETAGDEMAMDWYEEIPEGRGLGDEGSG